LTARLLVVDDVAANGRLLEADLTANYYVVKFISDSAAVLDTVREWEPDVILLDIMMPNIDGYEVCRSLKSRPATKHIPVIMVTALNSQAERRRGLAVGADEFLVKPVESEILLARLRGIVRLKQSMDEWRARGNSASALGLISNSLQDVLVAPGSALIVEDLTPRSIWIQDVMTQGGIRGVVAGGEAECVSAVAEINFDIIIISLSLMSGDPLRLLAKLKASPATRDTPVLLIAEPGQRQMLINGLDLGANDCISVPLDDTELLLRAKNHIRRKQYQDRLRVDVGNALELAAIDPLTKLFNRRYLTNVLERLCANPNEPKFAVLMIDADHFKQINDRFGHSVGDQVLTEMAGIIRASLRKSDVVARYGGEEFIVILTGGVFESRAENVAEKLRAAVEQNVFEPKFNATISIGLAMSSAGVSASTLLTAADRALYDAKRIGRNRVVAYRGDYSDTDRRKRFEA
jgi:two-component system cell cycle response regulator